MMLTSKGTAGTAGGAFIVLASTLSSVGGIPLAEQPHGFWIMVGVIVAVTVVLGWLVVRRLRPRE